MSARASQAWSCHGVAFGGAWRDRGLAIALMLAFVALLAGFSAPKSAPLAPRLPIPPLITYRHPALMSADCAEYYDEWNAAHSPALFALSAAIMLPAASTLGGSAKGGKRAEATTLTPPLDPGYPFRLSFDRRATEDDGQLPLLIAPRDPAMRRTIVPPRSTAGTALAAQRKPLTPPFYRLDLAGDLRGRSVDISPMFALEEPAEAWSFSAVLRYDKAGQVQHALLESAELPLADPSRLGQAGRAWAGEPSLRAEVVRRLYQCRIQPSGTAGEGRLTLYGPGRSSRP
ncbi:MAG: hypothetical protein HYV36_03595 [Lentisphaerae bacterium]|nr:hypothetical protein [Lentisphaerota bacterium]